MTCRFWNAVKDFFSLNRALRWYDLLVIYAMFVIVNLVLPFTLNKFTVWEYFFNVFLILSMFFIMHIVFGLAYLFDRTKQNSNRSIELKNTILDYKRSLFNRSQFHHYYLQLLLALSGYFFFAYSMMSFIEDVFHGDKLLRSFSFWILLVGKIYLAFKVCDLLSLTKGTRKRISMLPIGIIIT